MYLLHYSLPSDLDKIAACHKHCFAASLSAQLGNSYIKKTMEWFLAGDNRFLVHVTHNDEIIGYCGGFTSLYAGDGSVSGMMQYAMREAIKSLMRRPWLLLKKEVIDLYPLIKRNVVKRFFRKKQTKPSDARHYELAEKRTGLVVIGVQTEYRGKGVFEMLMAEFEKQTRQHGIYKMMLSVKKDNERAVHAYQKVGWTICKENKDGFQMMKMLDGIA